MAILGENDVLFAHKALNIVGEISKDGKPGQVERLSEATKRVAAAIIDHFNKRTGQCDPGIDRLSKLLGISRATVIRATEQLDELGLIEKTSHGGKSHRASYRPNWEHFRAIVEDWDERMRTGAGPSASVARVAGSTDKAASNVASVRPSTSQPCDSERRSRATQTHRINPSKEPIEGEQVETQRAKPPLPVSQRPPNSLGRSTKPTGQRSFLLPIPGGGRASHSLAAESAAERRWEMEARNRGGRFYALVAEWMTPDRQATATRAEMARRGGGIAYIIGDMGGPKVRNYQPETANRG